MSPSHDRDERPWTLTDALAEAFDLGFKTATDEAFKDSDDALEDDDVADRLSRIQDKFADEAMGTMSALLDSEPVEEEEDPKKESDHR